MKKRRIWIRLLQCVFVMAGVFFVYTEQYYHADVEAVQALQSDSSTEITRTEYGWFFDGPSEEYAMVFYPGGKVEETAYAPLLHRLAEAGMDVCLVKMPARLAVFGGDKAAAVMGQYDYSHWYIGGHSLGGVMAAGYAAKHPDQPEGIILLASYPTGKISEEMNVITIRGSEDGVLNMQKYEESRQYLPADTEEYVIPGGNHAGFGSYGIQKGDGTAGISSQEQITETVQDIMRGILPEEAHE